MKLKTLSLVAGMILAANVGLAQATELDKTAGMPDIFGAVATHEATLMTGNEMAAVEGEYLPVAVAVAAGIAVYGIAKLIWDISHKREFELFGRWGKGSKSSWVSISNNNYMSSPSSLNSKYLPKACR